jgi:hypothetical protein
MHAVALEENTTQAPAVNEPPPTPDAHTVLSQVGASAEKVLTQQKAPPQTARPSKLPALPRKGGGWIKKW